MSLVGHGRRTALVLALLGTRAALAAPDEPTPTDTPPPTTTPPPATDDRDHDKDLDHDTVPDKTRVPDRPDHPDGGDPTDRPLYAPRLTAANSKDIVIEIPGERSSTNIATLATLGTVALAAGVFGLYYNLDGKKAADAVNEHLFTGRYWTPSDQANYDKAERDRTRAIVLYSAGGGILVAAAIVLIVTEPKSTTTRIHPHTAMIAPIPGGAIAARTWSF